MGKATGITWSAGIYNTQSAITSVHNSSEGTNISVHTTDSYNNGPKERFRFDHHGHARGVSFRGTKPAQKSFVLGGGDVVKQNLVLYYNFAHSDCYGTSGTSVIDLSGNSNTGYLGGNVSYSSTVGGIMDFAGGATNNGAFIGTPLTLPTTDSVSLMFWVYYDDQPASPGDYNLMGVASIWWILLFWSTSKWSNIRIYWKFHKYCRIRYSRWTTMASPVHNKR